MIKRLISMSILCMMSFALVACGNTASGTDASESQTDSYATVSETTQSHQETETSDEGDETDLVQNWTETEEGTSQESEDMIIRITVGDHVITATLYDNAAGRALWEKLPLTLPMMNLYGREMCYRFGAGGLPDDDAADTGYEIGDISYWPPAGSLVILYKQNGEVFEQQPIGHTDDDVSFFDGMPDTDVLFDKSEK